MSVEFSALLSLSLPPPPPSLSLSFSFVFRLEEFVLVCFHLRMVLFSIIFFSGPETWSALCVPRPTPTSVMTSEFFLPLHSFFFPSLPPVSFSLCVCVRGDSMNQPLSFLALSPLFFWLFFSVTTCNRRRFLRSTPATLLSRNSSLMFRYGVRCVGVFASPSHPSLSLSLSFFLSFSPLPYGKFSLLLTLYIYLFCYFVCSGR